MAFGGLKEYREGSRENTSAWFNQDRDSVCYTYREVVAFVESAFKHGYDEEDFFEVLESAPMKLRSRRGLIGVYELPGMNYTGDYLHIAFPPGSRP